MVKVTKGTYIGVESYEITNDVVKLVVTTGVGARIIHFGFCNKDNVLYVNESDFADREDCFKFYGGHRLWHSPEHPIRTYQKDNSRCEATLLPLGLTVSNYETENKIKKTMQIEMKDNGRVRIIHSIKNMSTFDYNLACWGITQMKRGGVAIFPQDTRKTGLLPSRSIALWDYTDLSDKRLTFTSKHIIIKQDETIEKAFKIGSFNREGYLGYFNNGDLFVKEFDVCEGEYPDYGCNSEVFVNDKFLELESLSPMTEILEGQEISHVETWELFGNVEMPIKEKYQEVNIKEYVNA